MKPVMQSKLYTPQAPDSCVFSGGVLAHDPHPSGAGVAAVEWCWYLRSIL